MAATTTTRRSGPSKEPTQAANPGDQQIDPIRAARTKRIVLQTSSVVLAAVVLAYLNLIDHRLAMGVIVVMYLTVRFFS